MTNTSSVVCLLNLPSDVGQCDVKQFFAEFDIKDDNIHIIQDKDSMFKKAFICFQFEQHVQQAIQKNNTPFKDSLIKVVSVSQSEAEQVFKSIQTNSKQPLNITHLIQQQLLTLMCEWDFCDKKFNDRTIYLSHINREHVRLFDSTKKITCKWQGCFDDCEFQNMDHFQLHLSFHAYHNQIMSVGQHVINHTKPKPTCYMDPSTRNVLNDLSNVLLCGWTGCCGEFFDAETFFHHVDTHATEDVEIPMMSKEKLKKIRFAKCQWLKCNASFKTKSHLKNHLRSHTQKKLIACPVCGLSFSHRNGFLNHCYRQETPTTVDTVQITNFEDDIDEHEGILTIDEEANPSSIVIHLPQNLQDILPTQATIINSNDLQLSNKIQSNDGTTTLLDGLANSKDFENNSDKLPNLLVSQTNNLNNEMSTALSNQNVTLLVNFSLPQSNGNHEISNNLPSNSSSQSCLTRNVIQLQLASSDTKDEIVREFRCLLCSKSFSTRALLSEHISNHVRKYVCPHCSYAAAYPNRLKEHILFRHSDTFNFKCQFCDQKFKTQRFLRRHIELHYSEKKISCEICSQSFTNYYSLNRHVRIVHLDEQIVFACHLCNKVYNRGCNLSRHLVHTHHLKVADGWSRFVYDKQQNGVYRLNMHCYTGPDSEAT